MKTIAIIPARAGSVRVPNKNLCKIGGKPLLAYTIDHAIKSKCVEDVFVSTNSDEIANVSIEHGAKVILRPEGLSGDKATSESALIHAVEFVENNNCSNTDVIVFLQCTSPVRNNGDIDSAMNLFISSEADSLLSVCKNRNFIWRKSTGSATPINYDFNRRPREQDMEPQYFENGSIYIFKTELLKKNKNRLGGKISMYEMDFWSSFQVDQPEDVELIDWIINKRRS